MAEEIIERIGDFRITDKFVTTAESRIEACVAIQATSKLKSPRRHVSRSRPGMR
jgi:hypothetical protein